MPINKSLWAFLMTLLLIISLLLLLIARTPNFKPSLAGKQVPFFVLTDLMDPTRFFSQQNLLGEVSLLNVWASWCGPCQAEHALLVKIKKNYAVPIYGLDYKDGRKDALQWLKLAGNPYRQIGQDREGKVAALLGVIGVPETFLIDSKGTVRYQYIGVLDETTWRDTLLPLVNRYQHDY